MRPHTRARVAVSMTAVVRPACVMRRDQRTTYRAFERRLGPLHTEVRWRSARMNTVFCRHRTLLPPRRAPRKNARRDVSTFAAREACGAWSGERERERRPSFRGERATAVSGLSARGSPLACAPRPRDQRDRLSRAKLSRVETYLARPRVETRNCRVETRNLSRDAARNLPGGVASLPSTLPPASASTCRAVRGPDVCHVLVASSPPPTRVCVLSRILRHAFFPPLCPPRETLCAAMRLADTLTKFPHLFFEVTTRGLPPR